MQTSNSMVKSQNIMKFLNIIILSIVFAIFAMTTPSLARSKTVVTVGNKNITEYDIKIRSNFELIVKNRSSTSRNRSKIRKTVIENLVIQQVQLQAAGKAGIVPIESAVSQNIAKIARGANMSTSKLTNFLKSRGSNISTMKDIQRAGMVWQALVRQKFGSAGQVSEKQIEEEANKSKKYGKKQTVYSLKHITLKMASNASKGKRNKRLAEAREIKANFTKCSRIRTLTANFGRVEVKSLANVSLSSLNSAQRNLIRKTKLGTISNARSVRGGVEMFALCEKTVAISAKSRSVIQSKLIDKKFSGFAKDYLKRVRAETFIKYR